MVSNEGFLKSQGFFVITPFTDSRFKVQGYVCYSGSYLLSGQLPCLYGQVKGQVADISQASPIDKNHQHIQLIRVLDVLNGVPKLM